MGNTIWPSRSSRASGSSTAFVLTPTMGGSLILVRAPDEAAARFSTVPQARVVAVQGAKHLWVGESYVRRALDEIVATVSPGSAPLSTTWDGEDSQAPQ